MSTVYNLSCLVFSPTSAIWSNCYHIIPDGLPAGVSVVINSIIIAPFVISSVLVSRDISVLSPTANFRTECNCLVFLGSLGICFNTLSLSSCD